MDEEKEHERVGYACMCVCFDSTMTGEKGNFATFGPDVPTLPCRLICYYYYYYFLAGLLYLNLNLINLHVSIVLLNF